MWVMGPWNPGPLEEQLSVLTVETSLYRQLLQMIRSSLCEPMEMSGWPFGTFKQTGEIETVRSELMNLRLSLGLSSWYPH